MLAATLFVGCVQNRRDLPRVSYWWRGHPVFLSYRRCSSSFASGWLRDRLVAKLGRKAVIRDVDSIAPGVSFVDFIRGVIPDCRAVVAMIDPEWSVAGAGNELRHVLTPGDMVAYELGLALEAGVPVIPVLIRGASMPVAETLPENLRRMSQLQALEVRADQNFCADVDRLIAALKRR